MQQLLFGAFGHRAPTVWAWSWWRMGLGICGLLQVLALRRAVPGLAPIPVAFILTRKQPRR